jgi:aquaporin PIP
MRFLLYVPMQMLGAIVGSAIVAGGNPGAFRVFGGAANGISPGVLPFHAWGLEAMSTFALMFTVLAATDSKRHPAVNHLPVRLHMYYKQLRLGLS